MRLFTNPRSSILRVDLRAHGFGRYSTGETEKTAATIAGGKLLLELRNREPDAKDPKVSIGVLQKAWAGEQPNTRQGRGNRQRTKA